MLPLSRVLWVATLVRSASASEATSPNAYDDETSLLQVVHRHVTDGQAGTATNQRRKFTQLESGSQEAKEKTRGSRFRCSRRMSRAPGSIKRAMFGDNGEDAVNVCEDFPVVHLRQSDFTDGTYIIRNPGIYRLREDIVMEPRTEYMLPPRNSTQYPLTEGYWLGFVAAIAVASDNVYLDLSGKTISMSPEFLMRQRFFSVVQLGERPFDAAAGPPQFNNIQSSPFWASNVVISSGNLGMTSHTGVHGWHNNNIWIRSVKISDFETAGIQINGGTNIHIQDAIIGPNLGHSESSGVVPGLATLSQATLLLRIVEGEQFEEEDPAFGILRDSVERYIDQTLAGGVVAESEQIFKNEAGLPDGSSLHGIVLHAASPAIHDFASCAEFDATDESNFFGPVRLKRVEVKQLKLGTDEVVSMKDSGGKPIMGPAGDVLQVFRFGGDAGTYAGNVLSDAQLALGRLKLGHDGDEDDIFRLFGALNIPSEFIDWTQGTTTWEDMKDAVGVTFVCSKDAMTHHNKGIMGVRIEYYSDVKFSDVEVKVAENVGRASLVSHCTGDDETYKGNDVRGVTMSHVSDLRLRGLTIQGMTTQGGAAFGFEERIEVNYRNPTEVGHSPVITDIEGALGSIHHDVGLIGMLNSDVGF